MKTLKKVNLLNSKTMVTTRSQLLKQKLSWLPATKIRNYILKDPILDWLNLYGNRFGYVRDLKSEYNFSSYIMLKGIEFEKNVYEALKEKVGTENIVKLNATFNPLESETLNNTIYYMRKGVPFIYQGVVHNTTNGSYGIPDLLVRSDYLGVDIESEPGCTFSDKWHYRVVDIKYSSLHLGENDVIKNYGSIDVYKAQVAVYNLALGEMQGYTPEMAHLVGRKVIKGETTFSSLDKLGTFSFEDYDYSIIDEAIEWYTDVKKNGSGWSLNPHDSNFNQNLYPNMSNTSDYPWHNTKKKIASRIKELTLLWYISPRNRGIALNAGINNLNHPEVSSSTLGVDPGSTRGVILDKILIVNKELISYGPDKMKRLFLQETREKAKTLPGRAKKRLYVDFETVTDLNNPSLDPSLGKSMVYMIGTGIEKDNEWKFKEFTVDHLNLDEEEKIYYNWVDLVNSMDGEKVIYHWTKAETSHLRTMAFRYPEKVLENVEFVDLCEFFMNNKIAVPGCYNFKLKDVSNSLYKLGLINTTWNTECIDGLGASVIAWKCNETGFPINKIKIIRDVKKYNEIDCKVMYEICNMLINKKK